MGTIEVGHAARERGQVAVFAMMGLLVLFLGIVLLGQIGLLTHRACHAQAVADCSAMSGAVTQAATLNQLARWNQEIVDAFDELVAVCNATLFPNRAAALAVIRRYESQVKILRDGMAEANAAGADLAMRNALLTCLLNGEGRARFEYLGTDDLAEAVLPEPFFRWEDATIVFRYMVGYTVVTEMKQVPVWMVKEPGPIVAFAAGADFRAEKALDGEGAFRALPALRAAGQAKPTGGQIFEPTPEYLAKLIALKTPQAPFARRFGEEASRYEQ